MLWASPVGRLMCLVYRQEIMEMTIDVPALAEYADKLARRRASAEQKAG